MTLARGDAAILDQIRELAADLADDRARGIVRTVVDAVALNPQPLPPETVEILQSIVDAIALPASPAT